VGARGLRRQLQGEPSSERAWLSRVAHPHLQRQLETDPELLIPKAQAALERYGHQVVIGNDLALRKQEVVFVEPARAGSAGERAYTHQWLRLSELYPNGTQTGGKGKGGEVEIEEDIVRELSTRHQRWIEQGQSK